MAKKEEVKKELTKAEKRQKLYDSINEKGKEPVIVNLGASKSMNMERISFGSIGLDYASGGGAPCGRIIEIFGPESSGKSSISTILIAEAQKKYPDKFVGYIDSENGFDREYAVKLGVDPDEIEFSQTSITEKAWEVAEKMIDTGDFSVIVMDSVAAMVPKAELEGDIGDSKLGLQARLMSQILRKITEKVNRSKTLLIVINQERDKIGVMFGPTSTTTSGNALKYYASIRIRTSRSSNIEVPSEDKEKNYIGMVMTSDFRKNKVAPPFRKPQIPILFGIGYDFYAELIEYGSKFGVINKSGSWYAYGDTKLGQGSDNVALLLKDNPELTEEIKKEVYKHIYE